ncbi:MAG: hypothetical protein P0Y53_21080 [Candidatus Pseudobacter hemicellulosilyticus]|uniref:Lipoprotein n=1 Tax=Candidatus Pseudobacter hemicellulosilyticus TaxID=3121375 RepID=A0AAJ5WQN5_9BACT|nr:MAG: hypothetical protein P0Y53_21080 [Pseudobacter sp.]
MTRILLLLAVAITLGSCGVSKPMASMDAYSGRDTLITESLFNDRSSTISEAAIQQILDGQFKLPQQMRVAIVRIDNTPQKQVHWNDEQFLSTQQAFLDQFSEKLRQSPRVTRLTLIPDIVVAKSSYTNIREAAVRMQADVVVVYSITTDLYSKYKAFANPDMKAFATTQLVLLDVRTGLIPFSTIVTKNAAGVKAKSEMDIQEARNRLQQKAVLETIDEISKQLQEFLKG